MDNVEARARALALAVGMRRDFGSVTVPDVIALASEYADFILRPRPVPTPLPPTTPLPTPEPVDNGYTDLGPGGLWGPPCYNCGHVQGVHLDVTRRGCQFESIDEGDCSCPRFETAPVPAPDPETPKAKCTCHRHNHRSISPNSHCIATGCLCMVRP